MRLLSPLLFVAAVIAAPPAAATDCGQRLCNAPALQPVARQLAQAATRPVHILQIGDSHSAGDMIADGWRTRLNASHGNGGRGIVPGGRPFPGYLTWGLNAQWTSGWAVNGIFGRNWQDGGAAVGLSGYTKTARAAGQSLSLTVEAPAFVFDQFTICGIAGPDAGTLAVTFAGTTQELHFAAPVTSPLCRDYRSPFPVGYVAVTTRDDRPVSVTSMATFRSQGGVSLSNLGVPGSQLQHFARTSDAQVQAELRAYHPDLVILAFGTNEGFDANFDAAIFETTLRGQVRRLRRLMGTNVPVMLLGPPNAMTRNSGIAYAGGGMPTICETGLLVPANLAAVRDVQRRVAADMGLAFWDWARAMGNDCAMFQWRAEGFVVRDVVHFTRAGGTRLGGLLADDFLMAMRDAPRSTSR